MFLQTFFVAGFLISDVRSNFTPNIPHFCRLPALAVGNSTPAAACRKPDQAYWAAPPPLYAACCTIQGRSWLSSNWKASVSWWSIVLVGLLLDSLKCSGSKRSWILPFWHVHRICYLSWCHCGPGYCSHSHNIALYLIQNSLPDRHWLDVSVECIYAKCFPQNSGFFSI